jgi:hypothetical protein
MDSKYEIRIRSKDGAHIWVLTCDGDELCYSPTYNTETKTAIEAMFFSTIFGVEFVQPLPEKPKRHLSLVVD